MTKNLSGLPESQGKLAPLLVSSKILMRLVADCGNDAHCDTNTTEQEDDDTISEIPTTANRPTAGLTRNFSEMSIECSTANENYDAMLDDEIIQDDLSNRAVIEAKVKTAFALPASETLINGRLN